MGRGAGLPAAMLLAAALPGPLTAETAPRPLPRPETRAAPVPRPDRVIPPDVPVATPEDADCRARLTALGAAFDTLPAITEPDQPGCGIAAPVRLRAAPHGIAIEGGAVMRCDMALALVRWLRDSVRPAAALLDQAPQLTAILPGSTYQCRVRRGGSGAVKLSEHATGGAFDVMGFRWAGRDDLAVETAEAPRDVLFLRLVRSAACRQFATVLGPGSNAAHDDHLHLDLAQRRGGFRLCE